MMLATCVFLYISGILVILIGVALTILYFIDGGFEDFIIKVGIGAILLGGLLLAGGIYKNNEGNKQYDKTTNVYSLSDSNDFTLGIGDGYYYYNVNPTMSQLNIKKVSVSKTTLIQKENLEQSYVLEQKVKWEETEWFLYVPEDVKFVQYSSK